MRKNRLVKYFFYIERTCPKSIAMDAVAAQDDKAQDRWMHLPPCLEGKDEPFSSINQEGRNKP